MPGQGDARDTDDGQGTAVGQSVVQHLDADGTRHGAEAAEGHPGLQRLRGMARAAPEVPAEGPHP
eukprot:15484295-Alexandrium_andersonii.AAC.1